MVPSAAMMTSRAGKLARVAMPIFQSQPNGRTKGSIARPACPRKLSRSRAPASSLVEAIYLSGEGGGGAGRKFRPARFLVGEKRQRPDKDGGRKNNSPGPPEERPTAVVHAEQHDPPRRHFERG